MPGAFHAQQLRPSAEHLARLLADRCGGYEIEQFTAMLRNWCTGLKWQLLILLTNPRHPKHWLLRRVKRGLLTRYQSLHIDNPKWYDAKANKWTPKGRAYCKNLSNMTGVRRRRLFLGEWCAAEGAVWEAWEESLSNGTYELLVAARAIIEAGTGHKMGKDEACECDACGRWHDLKRAVDALESESSLE